ncbi:spr1629 family repressor/antitoxin [Staphylococcus durrellii]|uniref:spr1629 family repressor/antitoxin n=1 Tax=Staphylococcus durrellii TaxID=2781773 RepID=UPI0018A03188|nr:XRE family transcriptional regulator [Staphylococcus durrellii]MBF7015988.1 XRE family transcriptional regulator [Staphylococcus durrellii]
MFIGENLENIRILSGYSRKELADKINISEQAIWQYETKNMMPEINKIHQLAKLFHVKTAYFISEIKDNNHNELVNKHAIAFRAKNQQISIKLLNKQYYQANYIVMFTNYIFKYLKLPQLEIFNLLKIIDSELGQIEEKKYFIKQTARIAREVILNNKQNSELLFSLEQLGIVIYEKNIDNDADAYSFWTKNDMPYIVLGNSKGITARRHFDLAHELGHILCHRQIQFDMLSNEEHKIIEQEADLFAAEFLLPAIEFKEDFNKITKKSNPDYLTMIKEKWQVSIQAMAMRAYYLGVMSNSQYRYFWASINKKGYKKLEPLDEDIKLPRPVKINSLLKLLFSENIITPNNILDTFKVETKFLKDICNIDVNLFLKYMNKEIQEENIISNYFNIDKYR